MRRWHRLLLGVLAWCCVAQALAHKPSDSYMTLTAQDGGLVQVNWHVAFRDLASELDIDSNDDGRLTWGEIRAHWAEMLSYARSHWRLSHDGEPCGKVTGSDQAPAVVEHTDGQYAAFGWTMKCPLVPAQPWASLDVDYQLFALTDPTHRGIVRMRTQGAQVNAQVSAARDINSVVLGVARAKHHFSWRGLAGLPAVSGSVQPRAEMDVPDGASSTRLPVDGAKVNASKADVGESRAEFLMRYVQDGIEHIAAGADHILFLVTLLMVSVWRRPQAEAGSIGPRDWLPQARWRSVLAEVLRLVTAFTLAHSLTLALAAFGVVSPPAHWIEPLIALSVLLAALDNVRPFMNVPRWMMVFGFGLIHGFGFAGAMQDLGLSRQELAWPLLGFNLGVELGQLMLVALVLPLAYWSRHTAFYRLAVVRTGSLAIAVLASLWLYQRVTDVSLAWVPG